MSSRPVKEWKKGDKVRCVKPINGLLTQTKIYTLLLDAYFDNFEPQWYVRLKTDVESVLNLYASRFVLIESHKEFTDEEYESLLI